MPMEKVNEYCAVKRSKIHGNGVFAIADIPKGARVIQYVGEKISKRESDRRGEKQLSKADKTTGAVYIFTLNKRYDIDGNVKWNPARFINHSCDPNCEAINEDNEIWIHSIKEIKKGQELSYNYGYDIDEWKDHPCRCGSEKCVGYIAAEDQWPKLRRRIIKESQAKKN